MPRNQIKALRKKRGWSSEVLAEKVGISQGHMSRIENGTRGLSIPLAEEIANVLAVGVQDVLGLNSTSPAEPQQSGLAEDATPYVAGDDERMALPRRRENVDPYVIRTNALDKIGIARGDVVEVDCSAAACEDIKPMQAVVVQLLHPDPNKMVAVTLIRQFVPPALLITNSSVANAPMLDMDRDEVHIRGVIIAVHRTLKV